jgi:hypothetical protein
MKRKEPSDMEQKPAGEEAASPLAPRRPWVKPAIVEEDCSATEAGGATPSGDGGLYS